MVTIKIEYYEASNGKSPFVAWLEDLDKPIRYIIKTRLTRVMGGNFGDSHPVKGALGIAELRFDIGAGYRIYYGKQGEDIVILLVGGDKGTQSRDIEKAKRYWCDYKGKKS